MKPNASLVRLLWVAVGLLSVIGVAVVVRRLVDLQWPSATARSVPGLDEGFARHAVLTRLHILPGLVFILLGPLQSMPALRRRWPLMHRWLGRVFVAAGALTGVTALVMSPRMAIGGANETAATTLFGVVFLFALVRAYVHARNRRFALHREWMIRTYAVGLAVATIRPIVGLFFATSRLTHLTPHEFFGIAFWLGFTMQSMAAEAWINYTRPGTMPARQI